MNKLKDVLKKYDKMLTCEKSLNGKIDVYRQSPFNVERKHIIFSIENQNIGSGLWVRNKLSRMDNQKLDLVGQAIKWNEKIRNKKSHKNMNDDIATFFVQNETFLI